MSPTSFQTAPPRGKKIKWAEMDSNHRSITQQIYSLSPLATRESTHLLLLATSCFKQKADDRTRTDNLLITNQLLCQLSHIGVSNLIACRSKTLFSRSRCNRPYDENINLTLMQAFVRLMFPSCTQSLFREN